jgi:hypothetical protein
MALKLCRAPEVQRPGPRYARFNSKLAAVLEMGLIHLETSADDLQRSPKSKVVNKKKSMMFVRRGGALFERGQALILSHKTDRHPLFLKAPHRKKISVRYIGEIMQVINEYIAT